MQFVKLFFSLGGNYLRIQHSAFYYYTMTIYPAPWQVCSTHILHTITLRESFYLEIYCPNPYIYKVILDSKGFDNTKYSLMH